MVEYSVEDVVITTRLRDVYGDEIILTEEGGEGSSAYKLMLEFEIHDRRYAVLRSEGGKPDDAEPVVYRVTPAAEGEYEIETIEDDEEWENVSELVDEMMISFPEDTHR